MELECRLELTNDEARSSDEEEDRVEGTRIAKNIIENHFWKVP